MIPKSGNRFLDKIMPDQEKIIEAEDATVLVREADKDRHIAALFAPADRRGDLLALHAFDIELSRIPQLAKQQIAGEIRLQWWREAVDGSNAHEAEANPVAAALMQAIARRNLPRGALQAMIDARGSELFPEPFSTADDMLVWCDGLYAAQLRLAARVLDAENAPPVDTLAVEAGRVLGVTQLLMSFAARASDGQCIVPLDMLARHGATPGEVTAGQATPGMIAALADMRALARDYLARAEPSWRMAPASLRPAFLLLALVAPRLRLLDASAATPFIAADVPQWKRMWRMWRAG
jgi:phytoene synthase